jgi:hypothetical protein
VRKLVLQQAAISLDGYICEEGTEFCHPVHIPRLASQRSCQSQRRSRIACSA